MRKAVMLASQSNTGSSWVASAIRMAHPELRGWAGMKEYLNPVLNWEHQDALGKAFGCELYAHVPLLAAEVDDETIARALEASWDRVDALDFTKENFLAYRLDGCQITERFDVVGLVGDVRSCFPPERHRVKVWYDAWYQSMMMNGRFDTRLASWLARTATTAERRALVGWQGVRWKLGDAFEKIKAPVLNYEFLLREGEAALAQELSRLRLPSPIDARRLARVLVDTRKQTEKVDGHARQWKDAFEFYEVFLRHAWPQGARIVTRED